MIDSYADRPLDEPRPENFPWQVSNAALRELGDGGVSEPGLTDRGVKVQTVKIGDQTLDAANQSSYGYGRLTGPVAALKLIANRWRLSDEQVKTLLKLNAYQSAADLFRGASSLHGDDQRHRAGYFITIDGLLNAVFRDPNVSFAWLTERKQALDGDAPLDRMLSGTVEDILSVKHLVEILAGQ